MRVPFQVEVHQQVVNGMMHIPEKKRFVNKVVIMCYGLNGNRTEEHRMSVKLGDKLINEGVTFVRFDYRGQGISCGEMNEVNFASRVEDVGAVIDFVRGCFNYENIEYYVIGFSDGARIVPQVCINNEKIRTAILWNPIFSMENSPFMKTNSVSTNENRLITNITNNKKCYQLYGLPISIEYLRDIRSKKTAYDEFAGLECEKICIWGEDDQYSQMYRETMCEKKGVINYIVKDATHLFNGKIAEDEAMYVTMQYILGEDVHE